MKIVFILICLTANAFKSSEQHEYDGLINALTEVFERKHVQTVTATTCWHSDANSQLLFEMSSADISVNFRPSVIPEHDTWYRHGILVDVSCTGTADALFRQASEKRLFNAQNEWILVDSTRRDGDRGADASSDALKIFQDHLNGAYVLPESRVYAFVEIDGDDDAWEIWEGFKVGKSEEIRVYKHGTVTSTVVELNVSQSISLRTDLRGITLKATTVISEPDKFKGFYPFAETDLDIFAHMHYDMNVVLRDQLNFKSVKFSNCWVKFDWLLSKRMSLEIVDSFGWDLGNGSFGGLTGQLQREECDFGGIGSFIRADRMTVVDYTVGTFYRQPAALFKQPPLSSVRNICILPFEFEVWMVTFFTFLGFTVLIVFLSRITERVKHNEDGEALTVLDSVTIVHGAICQQGYTMNLDSMSIRVAIFVLYLTTVFLFTSYSASIVALLQSPSDSIKTIRDLAESSMTFSAQITPYGKIYFDETDDPFLRKIYDKKMKPLGPRKFTIAPEGIGKIRTEFHGFMVEVVSAYKLINKLWREEEKCGVSEITMFKLPILALAVVKRSGYKDILKQKLMHQEEAGLKNRITRRWMPPKPLCDSSNRASQFVSVSIKEIYPMLQIYVFGLSISIVVLFFEIGYNTYSGSSTKSPVSYSKIFRFISDKTR